MHCPRCQALLEEIALKSITVHRCERCGSWCANDALRLLKDREEKGDYRWIDIDLWKEREKFRAGEQEGLLCPQDGKTLVTVRYGEAPVRVDICAACRGIWLDRGEYDKILQYLEEVVDTETVGDYLDDVREEFAEVLTGRESVGSGLADLGKILYLLQLRFGVEHPNIATILARASRLPGT